LIFSFYSPILDDMRALPFPKCCVVCCKKCGHDVLSGTDGFPAHAIFVVCSLCGEKRRYLASEVMHGRPHFLVRRKRGDGRSYSGAPNVLRRAPVSVRLGPLRAESAIAGLARRGR
jgi:hypothetical protein